MFFDITPPFWSETVVSENAIVLLVPSVIEASVVLPPLSGAPLTKTPRRYWLPRPEVFW